MCLFYRKVSIPASWLVPACPCRRLHLGEKRENYLKLQAIMKQQDLHLISFSCCWALSVFFLSFAILIAFALSAINLCSVFSHCSSHVNRILLQCHRFAGLRAVLQQTVIPNSSILRFLLPHHDGADVLLWLEFPCKSISAGVERIVDIRHARSDYGKGKLRIYLF